VPEIGDLEGDLLGLFEGDFKGDLLGLFEGDFEGDLLGLFEGLFDGIVALHPAVGLISANTVSDQAPPVSRSETQKNAPPLHAKSPLVPPEGV
jgi:hypothetical protein